MEIIINVALSVQMPQQLILLTCHSHPSSRHRCMPLLPLPVSSDAAAGEDNGWGGSNQYQRQSHSIGHDRMALMGVSGWMERCMSLIIIKRISGEGVGGKGCN